MQVLGFSHYNLRAPRELLEALRGFYVEVIGLKVGARPPFKSFGYWLYAGDEAVLHLTESSANEAPSIDTPTTFNHAAFNCSNRPLFESKLARMKIAYKVAHVPQTNQVQLFLRDPAGNGVELNFSGTNA